MNPIALIGQKLAARRYRKATGMDRPIEELARENRATYPPSRPIRGGVRHEV